jgi:hypothetical protein
MTLSKADIDLLFGPEPADSVESLLDAPVTGEDISLAMQDPAFTPTQADYLKYEEYARTKQTDWINTIAQSVDAAANMIGGAISEGAQGAVINPLNYIEGAAQGTRQLYGLAAQSQDPSSPLFKFKDLVAGSGTPESRYQQFLEARDFANTSARLERGEEGLIVPPEYTNPEYVQGVSMILDPTLFVPGVGEILGAGKLATRAVGKGTQLAGRAVAGAARPLERFAGAAERMTAEALGMAPEALRNTAATAGIAGALGIAPEAAAFAAIPAGIRTAREAGEALTRAGENLMTQPSRVGPLEAIGAAPGANLRQRMLGVVGQYGGDAALDASLRGIAGGIEGAAVGTGLGFLSGGEEGAAAGLGSGGVQGSAGALGGRMYQKLTGAAAKEARAGDLGRFIDAQQDPTTKALFERVRDQHGVDTASALMDVEGLVKGRFGDVDVKYLSDTDFVDQYKGRARGVQVEIGDRPTIVINADILGKGKGDSPLYTLGHELFHALEKSEQLAGGATEIKNALVGRWIQEGDVIRKLSDGAFNDAEIEARFNEYRDKLSAGSPQRAAELAQFDTINKKADYIASELAAEHFAALIAGQKPDAMLKGFSGLTRQLLDAALTQNASKAIANAAASIERTFGVKPTDSVLFPDLKQASPQVNAMLRDLVRARRKLDEKIMLDDSRGGRVLKPEDVSNPLAAKELVDLGLAEQMPDGSIRNLSSEEIRARDDRDVTSLRSIVEKVHGARLVDGEVLGRYSPEQLSAIEQSQTISSRMKDLIRGTNLAIENGNSLFVTYFAALKRVRNKLTKKYSPKYDSGIRVSEREFSPYSFKITKADNPVVNAIDITKVRNELSKLLKKDGSIGGLWSNTDGFMTDLARYFTNLDQKEGARRSAEIFGVEKAKFLGDFVGAAEKGGSKFVRSFRLDRVGSMSPMDFKAKFSEEAYQLSKQRWMPAETIGDKSVINSDEGYRIISGAKHKLYGPDGKLIGIYDTQTQAERKADAAQARLQPEVRQQQYPARNEVGQTAEAGRGDSALGRTQGREEGRQELGTVRQAGDVITPESPEVAKKVASGDTSMLRDGEMLGTFRFMPPDLIDKLAVTDEQRQAMRGKSGFAFVSDWADAGRPYVTQLGRKVDVLMGGMGYPFLPEISGKGAWAGTFSGMTDKVMDKIKATDGIGLVVLGGPESSASSRAFSRAFGEELADSISQNPKLKEKLDKIARNARKQWIEYRRGEGRSIDVPEINSLEDWARLTQLERSGEQSERGLTFNDRDFLVRTIGSHDNKKALGIRSWKDVLRNYNLQNKDFTPGQVVAVVQFSGAEPVRAETIGAKPHPSYEALIPGKAIGTLPQKTMIKDVFRDFLSKTQPPAFTRKVQTNMPKFVVGEGDMRFMPSDQQGFYSKLEEVVNAKLPKVASPQQVLASVDPGKGSGVKPEELKWTGFAQAVERIAKENGGKVPKEKIIEHLKNEGQVKFEEVTSGIEGKSITQDEVDRLERRAQRTRSNADWSAYEDAVLRFESQELGTEAQYSRYQLPGGENYREVVLTSDNASPYTSTHFRDIPNYVAHMRVNERADNSGKPGLFIEEIQSDRHQQAREKGYLEDQGTDWSKVPVYQYRDLVAKGEFPSVMHIEVKDGLYRLVAPDGGVHHVEGSLEKLKKNYDSRIAKGIADAPFRKDWSLQMFKRALRDAVASGKEWIGWTTGETQAERFDLSKQVDYIDYRRVGPDKYDVSVVGKNGTDLFSETGINQSRVSDAVGKEIADKIAKGEGQSGGGRMTLRGLDLKVGGEGMKGFYDKILPSEVQKYVKQWGSEVKKNEVNTGQGKPTEYADFSEYQKARKEGQKTTIWRVDITPEMRKSVSESGQPRFMPAGDMATGRGVKDNSGNVIPLSQRFKATSEDIRFMPASDQDTKALQMLPKPRRSLDAAYRDGVKTRSQDPQYYDVPDYVGYDMARTAAFEMGREGAEPPRWVMAERIGKLPTEGRSKNFAEDRMERGVSVLRIVGEPQSDVGTYEMFNPGEKRYVAGWLVGLGSDGEPLLADAVDLGPASSDVRMMPSPDSAMPGAYSFPGGYRAIPGKAKGSLRLYGPAGSLIGIAASLDEAQRIIRKKVKQ